AASAQRPRGARGLCRRRRALDQRASACRSRCQRKPAAPCTAGRGVGKGRPHGARHRRLQSRAKTLRFLGVFAARGSDTLAQRTVPRALPFQATKEFVVAKKTKSSKKKKTKKAAAAATKKRAKKAVAKKKKAAKKAVKKATRKAGKSAKK